MTDAADRFAETAAAECPYSGLTVWHCKTIDVCDCFEFAEVEQAVAAMLNEGRARYAARTEEET